MLDKGELNTDGHLTTLEILLLKSIVIYFILHGFDVSVQNIFYVYKQIYSVSLQCELVEFPLFERNIEHIQRFLSKLFCIIQILNSLLKLSWYTSALFGYHLNSTDAFIYPCSIELDNKFGDFVL